MHCMMHCVMCSHAHHAHVRCVCALNLYQTNKRPFCFHLLLVRGEQLPMPCTRMSASGRGTRAVSLPKINLSTCKFCKMNDGGTQWSLWSMRTELRLRKGTSSSISRCYISGDFITNTIADRSIYVRQIYLLYVSSRSTHRSQKKPK